MPLSHNLHMCTCLEGTLFTNETKVNLVKCDGPGLLEVGCSEYRCNNRGGGVLYCCDLNEDRAAKES